MANATIVSSWQDATYTYMAASVTEANGEVIEYIGKLATASLSGLTLPQKKAALAAAVKAVRDAQQANATIAVPGVTGSIVV